MLEIIINNPFRILGVYSNTSKKEIVANKGKLSAFARIGKTIPLETDFSNLFPTLVRTPENIAEAESKISLPREILKYSQFWFCKLDFQDTSALKHLKNWNKNEAISIWKVSKNFSALQNLVVCNLISEDYTTAFSYAEQLYTNHAKEYIGCMMSSELMPYSKDDLIHSFCDTMYQARVIDNNGWLKIDNILETNEFRDYLKQIRSTTYIKSINELIDKYKGGAEPDDNLQAAKELKTKSKAAVKGLQKVYDNTNPIYQTTMDKLSNAILSMTIAYYNKSNDNDCAVKALPLMEYASTLAVGDQQKHRCKTNTKTVSDAADRYNSPSAPIFETPVSTYSSHVSVGNELKSFLIPFLKVGGVLLGDTSRMVARLLGYNDILLTDSDSYGATIKGVKAYDIHSTGKYNSFIFYRYDVDEDLKKLFDIKKTYFDWKLLFENEGFIVEELEAPSIYKQTLNFFTAKIRATSYTLNVMVDIEFFCITFKEYASSFEPIDLNKVSVLTLSDQSMPFLSWFGAGNSMSSNSIFGDKTLQQLISYPLGDSSIDIKRATYSSIKNWIQRHGELYDYGENIQMCSFYNPPTTYRNKKISTFMFSDISIIKSFFIYISFDYKYNINNKNKINSLQDAISFCDSIKQELNILGYCPIGSRKYEEKLKYEAKGSKGQCSVNVKLEEKSYSTCEVIIDVTYMLL